MQVPGHNTPVEHERYGYSSQRLTHPLFQNARSNPKNIDTHLKPYLLRETFPIDLENAVQDYVNTSVTPGLYGHHAPDRPQWYYANCLVNGMLLGRAYSLLSTPTRPPKSLDDPSEFPFSKLPAELRLEIFEQYKNDLAQRQRFWDVMTRVFIKAFWSGRDPEEGSRYIAGVLVLTCGHALSSDAQLLRGHGKRWVWWDNRFAGLDHTWGWQELRAAVMATVKLPRGNTDIKGLRRGWETARSNWEAQADISGNRLAERERILAAHNSWQETSEYVSKNVLEVLDLAREHLKNAERDWTPPELAVKLLGNLFERNEEGHRIWQATGLVPQCLERLPEDEFDNDTQ